MMTETPSSPVEAFGDYIGQPAALWEPSGPEALEMALNGLQTTYDRMYNGKSGRIAHLTYSTSVGIQAACGKEGYSRDWYGTGTAHEQYVASKMPTCSRCEAQIVDIYARKVAGAMLSGVTMVNVNLEGSEQHEFRPAADNSQSV